MLPSCNLRIPADVHNARLALAVLGTVSGKQQKQTERDECGDGAEQQTQQKIYCRGG